MKEYIIKHPSGDIKVKFREEDLEEGKVLKIDNYKEYIVRGNLLIPIEDDTLR